MTDILLNTVFPLQKKVKKAAETMANLCSLDYSTLKEEAHSHLWLLRVVTFVCGFFFFPLKENIT